jgi:hypothetical protein
MSAKKSSFFYVFFSLSVFCAAGQDTAYRKPGLALEARVTTYLQGGYDLGIFYHPRNTRFSFGMLAASHDINGSTRELVFNSNDHEQLDIRLNWLISAITRYHFAKHGEGFFAELGLGAEEFEVSSAGQTVANTNGFVSPAVAYMWYPWKRSGLYIAPKITGNFILFREEEQVFHTATNFQLKPFFVAPSLAIGWKFDLR